MITRLSNNWGIYDNKGEQRTWFMPEGLTQYITHYCDDPSTVSFSPHIPDLDKKVCLVCGNSIPPNLLILLNLFSL